MVVERQEREVRLFGEDPREVIVPQLCPRVERPANSGRELQHAHVRIRWFQDKSPIDEPLATPWPLILTVKSMRSEEIFLYLAKINWILSRLHPV